MTTEYKLKSVMEIIDKFLEGDELNLEVIQRANLMAEKVSQKINNLEKENAKLCKKCKKSYEKGFEDGSTQPSVGDLMSSWGCDGRTLF